MEYSVNPKEVLRFQQQRIVTLLFKEFLSMMEELGAEHDIALDKLVAALPADYQAYVDLADYLTPERAQLLRKRILDRGNSTVRALSDNLDAFSISIN